jgi:hypothetical protein
MALTFKGQRFALLKTAPGGFLFSAILPDLQFCFVLLSSVDSSQGAWHEP